MNNKNKVSTDVETFFHEYASGFDSIYGMGKKRTLLNRIVDKTFRKSMLLRFEETLREIDSPEISSVLDVGCGSGRYAYEFLKLNKSVCGVDMAEGMLSIAEKVCEKDVAQGNAVFVKGNYIKTTLDKKYDAAVLMGLFDYIDDIDELFLKLKRDTSKIILASFPNNKGWLSKQRQVRYKIKKCPLYLYSKNDLIDSLNRCGLTNYKIKTLDREYYLEVTI